MDQERIRSIALATLTNLSRTGTNGKTFEIRLTGIQEIATRAAQMFSLDCCELRQSLGQYLASKVLDGDRDLSGNPFQEEYFCTKSGILFQQSLVGEVGTIVVRGPNDGASSGSPGGNDLGIMYGKSIGNPDDPLGGPVRTRHQSKATASMARRSSSGPITTEQPAGQKRKAKVISPSSSGEESKPMSTPSSSSSSSSSSSQQPAEKKPRHHDNLDLGGVVRTVPVEQYDLKTGRTIARFDKQKDAAEATGISAGQISLCRRGEIDQAGGFGWRDAAAAPAAARAPSASSLVTPKQTDTKKPKGPVTGKQDRMDRVSSPLQRSSRDHKPLEASSLSCYPPKPTYSSSRSSSSSSSSSSPSPSSRSPSDKPPPRHPGGRRGGVPVEQYNVATGRAIARFESLSDAARATGIDAVLIGKCKRGEVDQAGDFGWRAVAAAAAAAEEVKAKEDEEDWPVYWTVIPAATVPASSSSSLSSTSSTPLSSFSLDVVREAIRQAARKSPTKTQSNAYSSSQSNTRSNTQHSEAIARAVQGFIVSLPTSSSSSSSSSSTEKVSPSLPKSAPLPIVSSSSSSSSTGSVGRNSLSRPAKLALVSTSARKEDSPSCLSTSTDNTIPALPAVQNTTIPAPSATRNIHAASDMTPHHDASPGMLPLDGSPLCQSHMDHMDRLKEEGQPEEPAPAINTTTTTIITTTTHNDNGNDNDNVNITINTTTTTTHNDNDNNHSNSNSNDNNHTITSTSNITHSNNGNANDDQSIDANNNNNNNNNIDSNNNNNSNNCNSDNHPASPSDAILAPLPLPLPALAPLALPLVVPLPVDDDEPALTPERLAMIAEIKTAILTGRHAGIRVAQEHLDYQARRIEKAVFDGQLTVDTIRAHFAPDTATAIA